MLMDTGWLEHNENVFEDVVIRSCLLHDSVRWSFVGLYTKIEGCWKQTPVRLAPFAKGFSSYGHLDIVTQYMAGLRASFTKSFGNC